MTNKLLDYFNITNYDDLMEYIKTHNDDKKALELKALLDTFKEEKSMKQEKRGDDNEHTL